MMMDLQWFQWLALAALGICLAVCLSHLVRIIIKGNPKDHAKPAGNTGSAIRYAFTGAMSPLKKESAFLHLPTYTAGLLYHIGTFLSLLLFFFIISGMLPTGWIALALMIFLGISTFSGIVILVKRIIKKELRALSNPDDFISNFLVTLFQFMTVTVIISSSPLSPFSSSPLPPFSSSPLPTVLSTYYLTFSALMLYLPVGKLRHGVYFFAARYHLGYFFGYRGVWPPGNVKN